MKTSLFHIRNNLLLKNLAFIYWHIGGIMLWLQALIVAGGILIAYFDQKPVTESLYMAYITALTVGYGEITPETGAARVVAIIVGFVGIMFTGIVVAASIRALQMTIVEQKDMEK